MDTFLSKTGVICCAERKDNLLMWSHYGGKHGGFCLEFRTEAPFFDKLRQVNYVSEIPRLNMSKLILNRDDDQLMKHYCTKFDEWKYEREWRVRYAIADTLVRFRPEALKAIYFGPKLEPHLRDMICDIVAKENPGVEF